MATVSVRARLFFAARTGYALAKYKYPLRNLLFLFVIGTMMIPWDVTLIPVYLTVRSLGLIDTCWALLIADLMIPFGIFLMRQICVDIPNERSTNNGYLCIRDLIRSNKGNVLQ